MGSSPSGQVEGQAEFWGPEGAGVCLKVPGCAGEAQAAKHGQASQKRTPPLGLRLKSLQLQVKEECIERAKECV